MKMSSVRWAAWDWVHVFAFLHQQVIILNVCLCMEQQQTMILIESLEDLFAVVIYTTVQRLNKLKVFPDALPSADIMSITLRLPSKSGHPTELRQPTSNRGANSKTQIAMVWPCVWNGCEQTTTSTPLA